MSDILAGPRIETYWWDLLDEDDRFVKTLDTVVRGSGTVTQNIDAVIRGGCQMTVAEELDWLKARVQPWVRVNNQSWPLGVFLTTSPTRRNTSTRVQFEVGGLDKLVVLDEWKADESFSVEADVPVIPKVIEMIQLVGEEKIVATESDKTTNLARTWDPGTSMLGMINDLLISINYSMIWVDGFGNYRLEPHVEPADRPVVRTFAAGEAAIHRPEWERSQEIADVPNRTVLTTTGDDETPGLRSVAENRLDDSPYSYQNRGNRWVTRSYEGVEAADQATLDALASRYLWAASNPTASYQVTHAIVPFDLGDAVRFVSRDTDVRAVVNEYRFTLKPGNKVEALWTEVPR